MSLSAHEIKHNFSQNEIISNTMIQRTSNEAPI